MTYPIGPHHDAHVILDAVGAVRRRLWIQRLLRRALWGAAVGLLAALAALVAGRWAGLSATWSKLLPVLTGVTGVVIAVIWPFRHRLSSVAAAKLADERLDLKDQFANAYEFVQRRIDHPMAQLTVERVITRLNGRRVAAESVPMKAPGALLFVVIAILVCWGAQRTLYGAQERRRTEVSGDLNASLLNYAEDMIRSEGRDYKASLALMEELRMLSNKADKEEILARLSRMIEDVDASADEAMKQQLESLKKLKNDFAMGELRRELQEELDRGHEELAVTDEAGQKVTADAIKTLALAERKRKSEELSKKVKEVAEKLAEKPDKQAEEKSWAVAEEKEAEAGTEKSVKREAASYADLEQIAQNRDIRKMILDAAADRRRASDAYKEVFTNYSRIMRTYLFEQNLPSGQKEYIRRYFRVLEPEQEGR